MSKTMKQPKMNVLLHDESIVEVYNQYVGDIIHDKDGSEETYIPFHSVVAIAMDGTTETVDDDFCTDIPDYEVADCNEIESE